MSHNSRLNMVVSNMLCSIKRVPYGRLNKLESSFVSNFITENKDLSDSDFKAKANLLFLYGKDGRDDYPHHIQIIEVLMSICEVA